MLRGRSTGFIKLKFVRGVTQGGRSRLSLLSHTALDLLLCIHTDGGGV